MDRLKPDESRTCEIVHDDLHSNMDRLKHCCTHAIGGISFNLHSNMDRLKLESAS